MTRILYILTFACYFFIPFQLHAMGNVVQNADLDMLVVMPDVAKPNPEKTCQDFTKEKSEKLSFWAAICAPFAPAAQGPAISSESFEEANRLYLLEKNNPESEAKVSQYMAYLRMMRPVSRALLTDAFFVWHKGKQQDCLQNSFHKECFRGNVRVNVCVSGIAEWKSEEGFPRVTVEELARAQAVLHEMHKFFSENNWLSFLWERSSFEDIDPFTYDLRKLEKSDCAYKCVLKLDEEMYHFMSKRLKEDPNFLHTLQIQK